MTECFSSFQYLVLPVFLVAVDSLKDLLTNKKFNGSTFFAVGHRYREAKKNLSKSEDQNH